MPNTNSNPNGFGQPWNPALHGGATAVGRGGGFPIPQQVEPQNDDPGHEGGFTPVHPPSAQEEPHA